MIRIIFFNKPHLIFVSAFNFWSLFFNQTKVLDSQPIWFLPANILGFIIFGILNIISFVIIFLGRKWIDLLTAIFIITFGGWLFLTNMYERYVFTGILSLLLISVYRPKLFKLWLVISLSYFLNLYRGDFPQNLKFIHQLVYANNSLGIKIIALSNVIIFFWLVKYFLKEFNFPQSQKLRRHSKS